MQLSIGFFLLRYDINLKSAMQCGSDTVKHFQAMAAVISFFKHILGCRYLLSYCDNGIELQIYAAMVMNSRLGDIVPLGIILLTQLQELEQKIRSCVTL